MKKIEIEYYYRNRNDRSIKFRDLVISYIELKNRLKTLKTLEEKVQKKLNRFIRICNWHSLTTYFVKSVIDSIQKNNGINISILVDICIEKSTVIDQHFFRKEN